MPRVGMCPSPTRALPRLMQVSSRWWHAERTRTQSTAQRRMHETSAECEPPPSRCADARFLVYYRDGTCVEGRCHWREDFYQCKQDCAGNGCNDNRTAPAAN